MCHSGNNKFLVKEGVRKKFDDSKLRYIFYTVISIGL